MSQGTGEGKRPKIIALYYPQLHPIPENDAWWGQGFTDWVNVRRARPLFHGHYQPRVPLGKNYYDQSRPEVVRAQVELARAYGVYGFCHYHYWFDGKQLLETPTNLFLADQDLDLHFCLAWANETWSKRWDGQDHHILQLQTHPPSAERWEHHFQYLLRAWRDRRAIRIDGRPLFLIYRPGKIHQLGNVLSYWRRRAREEGLPGLYFAALQQHHPLPPRLRRHFDAVTLFEPFVATATLPQAVPRLRHRAMQRLRAQIPGWTAPLADPVFRKALDLLSKPLLLDYDEVWQAIVSRPFDPEGTTFPGAFVDWDNTARYRSRATIYQGASPESFEFWMRRLLGAVTANRQEERFLFINAWNEWAESAYLEPDENLRYAYLEALQRALAG